MCQVRRILDEKSLEYVKILASGGLDEYELDRLVRDGAPIDLFGVGTKAGVHGVGVGDSRFTVAEDGAVGRHGQDRGSLVVQHRAHPRVPARRSATTSSSTRLTLVRPGGTSPGWRPLLRRPRSPD